MVDIVTLPLTTMFLFFSLLLIYLKYSNTVITDCSLLLDFTFNDLTTCFILETWRMLLVRQIVLINLDHLAIANNEASCFSCEMPQFDWLSALIIDIGFWYYSI